MDVVFERGAKEEPKGHALLYFRGASTLEEIWATYLVVLPITVDVSKYVPPFLMNQMGELGPKDLSAFAFPPAPEKLGSYSELEALAESRGDDVLFGGTINPTDVSSALMSVNEAVQWYAGIYSDQATLSTSQLPDGEGGSGFSVNEVLYGLMSDSDKLSELTKLVGRLRFTQEGGEAALMKEAEEEINLLANYLPDNHQVHRLIEVAQGEDQQSAELANLYLQRCFHLIQEEYSKLVQVEKEIKALEASESSS